MADPALPWLGDALLTILVPVRNAEAMLPGWLESAARYADAVVALDDGSTDSSRAILENHPLVTAVLSNPRRESYHGWDDLGNRQRLVWGARRAGARWLLFLDADERLDAADGASLRRFLETEARPGFAYGFEVFRMVDDDRHFDPRSLWVFRLFSAEDSDEPLGTGRLHFVPVPSSIDRKRWLFTSVRIQHSGSLTAEHRRARFDKYLEADPGNDFQSDYTTLLNDPQFVLTWRERAEGLPVLIGVDGRYADQHIERDETSAMGPIAISAVVIAQDDEDVIDRSVQALLTQEVDEPFEVIVVFSGSDGTYARVRNTFPGVRCVQLPERALPGEARNVGLWMARGEYVTFPGSHVWLLPGSLAARLAAHDDGWDMVTVSVTNGNTSRAGWASYFLDHAAQVPSRPSGEFTGVPGHASYVVSDVRAVGGFPEDVRAGEDTVVNRKLYLDGKRSYFCGEASFAHASPSTNIAHLVRHHFQRGRGLGRIIAASNTKPTRVRVKQAIPLPRRRLRLINASIADADDQLQRKLRAVRPLVAMGAAAAGIGSIVELTTRSRRTTSAGSPPTVMATASTPAPSVPIDRSAPVIVLSGRVGEAATGLLAAGSARQAAQHLVTLRRYGRSVCNVNAALAPIVTSATVSAESGGSYTIDAYTERVDSYLREARRIGSVLLLQIQPGGASLEELVARWESYLELDGVGVYLDLREPLAFAGQHEQFADAVEQIRKLAGSDALILVRGLEEFSSDVLMVDDTIDLRAPGSRYPHDALLAKVRPSVLVYH